MNFIITPQVTYELWNKFTIIVRDPYFDNYLCNSEKNVGEELSWDLPYSAFVQ